jgi:alkaline phosphatase
LFILENYKNHTIEDNMKNLSGLRIITNSAIILAFLISSIGMIGCSHKPEQPKNIILMISDGCGYNQVEAASLYQYGEKDKQVYAGFPVKYAMSTYPINSEYDPDQVWSDFEYVRKRVTDSAASGTAFSTGRKTTNGAIAVDTLGQPMKTVLEQAESLGKSSGVVTSVQLSHATPAAFVAHHQSRRSYEDIARQMILQSKVDVIMGCGHPLYDEDGVAYAADSLKNYKFVGGKSTWNAILHGQAANNADMDDDIEVWQLIQDKEDFQKLMQGDTPERVIGIPMVASTLQCNRKMQEGVKQAEPYQVPFISTVPTLPEMTAGALNVLDNNPDGFFLMIEGGAVDWAGHANVGSRLIEEEIDFNNAVQKVIDWVEKNSSWSETLLVITADHETGYLTGPGSGPADPPVWNPLTNNGKGNMPGMEFHSKSHTNNLVPFFAKGAGSDQFHAMADQTDPHRGKYLDNAEVGQVLMELFKK